MKSKLTLHRYINQVLAGSALALGVTLAIAAHSSHAQDRGLDVSAQLDKAKDTYKQATVVLITPAIEYPVRIDEAEFRRRGCTYHIAGKKLMSELLGILKQAEIVKTSPPFADPDWFVTLRVAVYLEPEKGAPSILHFEAPYGEPSPLLGKFNGTTTVTAKNVSFQNDLFKWASGLTPTNPEKCDFQTPEYQRNRRVRRP